MGTLEEEKETAKRSERTLESGKKKGGEGTERGDREKETTGESGESQRGERREKPTLVGWPGGWGSEVEEVSRGQGGWSRRKAGGGGSPGPAPQPPNLCKPAQLGMGARAAGGRGGEWVAGGGTGEGSSLSYTK